jgi:hypothetical protein
MKSHTNNLKLNVDAAFSIDEQAGASGWVIRNCHGGFVAASSWFIPHVPSPAMAEALHGLALVNSIGNALEAKPDSLEVIHTCLGEERVWNGASATHGEIMTQAGNLGKVEFMHCGRDLNLAAHELARNGFIF